MLCDGDQIANSNTTRLDDIAVDAERQRLADAFAAIARQRVERREGELACVRIARGRHATADVAERRMMGGMCFMVAGHMCCGASGARLMVRVGREAYAAALSEPHVRPLDLGGRRPVGYVLVDREGFASEALLRSWVDRALAAVASLPAR